MQADLQTRSVSPTLERVSTVLRFAGWSGFWVQLGLAIATAILLVFAITGRSFSRAVAPPPGIGVVGVDQGGTPGLGVGMFWAVCGIAALLVSVYLAFRQTRYAKRLRHPDAAVHPKKAEVMQLVRLGVIVGLIGMLVTILGGGVTLSVLLAKSISQPQGVAIYDPTRFIRSLDIFIALANMNGIAAHFLGTVASLGLLNWLSR